MTRFPPRITNFMPRQAQETPSNMRYEQLLLLEKEREYAANAR